MVWELRRKWSVPAELWRDNTSNPPFICELPVIDVPVFGLESDNCLLHRADVIQLRIYDSEPRSTEFTILIASEGELGQFRKRPPGVRRRVPSFLSIPPHFSMVAVA